MKVVVNSIPAACVDCSYEFDAASQPIVSSAVRTGASFAIALTNPASIPFTLADITVTMQGTKCLTLTGTTTSFTCTLETNADSSAALPAGTGAAKVHIKQIGYADGSGLTP